jgi:uncharacterized protein
MVIGEEALSAGPDYVFDTFLRLGVNEYALLEVKPDNQPEAAPGTATSPYVDPLRMGRFLARYYDRWLEHGDRSIVVRELRAIESRISGEAPGICKLAGGCLGRYYLIEPSGEVAHCDLFRGDPAYTLGNVLADSFATLRDSPRMVALRALNVAELERMSTCPEFAVCNGWCPHERYLSVRHNASHRADCCGLRELIRHVRARIQAPAPSGQETTVAATK